MAADGNADCTWTWSTGHFSLEVYLKQGKNKSYHRGKMDWTSEGKIYFTIKAIKANYSLSLLYHPLKTHEMLFLKGVGEYTQYY